jgi:hypothetical protein
MVEPRESLSVDSMDENSAGRSVAWKEKKLVDRKEQRMERKAAVELGQLLVLSWVDGLGSHWVVQRVERMEQKAVAPLVAKLAVRLVEWKGRNLAEKRGSYLVGWLENLRVVSLENWTVHSMVDRSVVHWESLTVDLMATRMVEHSVGNSVDSLVENLAGYLEHSTVDYSVDW